MNKNEFIKKLEEELSLSFNKSEINEQLDYYSKYINDEIKNGKSEKDVLSELGDPRLIAKTLKIVKGKDGIVVNDNSDNDERRNGSDYKKEKKGSSYYQPIMGNNSTIGCFIFLLIIFIVGASILRAMGTLVIGTAGLFFGSPLLFILLIVILYNIFKNR